MYFIKKKADKHLLYCGPSIKCSLGCSIIAFFSLYVLFCLFHVLCCVYIYAMEFISILFILFYFIYFHGVGVFELLASVYLYFLSFFSFLVNLYFLSCYWSLTSSLIFSDLRLPFFSVLYNLQKKAGFKIIEALV